MFSHDLKKRSYLPTVFHLVFKVFTSSNSLTRFSCEWKSTKKEFYQKSEQDMKQRMYLSIFEAGVQKMRFLRRCDFVDAIDFRRVRTGDRANRYCLVGLNGTQSIT